jgi:hypothetical protein
MRGVRFGIVILTTTIIVGGFFSTVSAARFNSTNFVIDASVVGNSFGGDGGSGGYKLTSSGGESLIGQGSGGSYKLATGYVAQLPRSLQLSVQPAALVAYYPFEENSGQVAYDASENENSGVLQAGVSWEPGKIGTAVDGNSVADVRVEDNPQLVFGQHMTVSLWAKQASLGEKAMISQWYFNGGSSSASWVLQTSPANTRLRMFIANSLSDTGNNCVDTDAAWTIGVWHHVSVVYDGTQAASIDRVKIYIDGVPRTMSVCAGTIPTSLQDSTSYLSIGAFRGITTREFNGSLDEVKLFARSMRPSEVKAEYDAGAAGYLAGLSFADEIVPGVSQTSDLDAVVRTDANAYGLAVSQDQDLTKGSDTIPAVPGSIALPLVWSEGTTKGLGFTLYNTNATPIPGKWNSGTAYAAFPGASTTFYTRNGPQGTKDILNVRLRLDVDAAQAAGTYTNVITTTGTIIP